MTVEEDLRATFARHEPETPAAGPLHEKIKAAVVRRKRRRAASAAAAAVIAVAVAFPLSLHALRPEPQAPAAAIAALPSSSAPTVPATGANILLTVTDRGRTLASAVAHVNADLTSAYLVFLPRPGTRTGLKLDARVSLSPAALGAAVDAAGGYRVCDIKTKCRIEPGSSLVKRLRSGDGPAAQSLLTMAAARLAPIKDMSTLQRMAAAAAAAGGKDLATLSALLKALPDAGSMPAPRIRVIRAFDGQSVYQAMRTDQLDAWATKYPEYVLGG